MIIPAELYAPDGHVGGVVVQEKYSLAMDGGLHTSLEMLEENKEILLLHPP